MAPSAIFKAIESAARLAYDIRLNNSSFGKALDTLNISSPKSMAFCQIWSFSNLK
jgi:hypothetical protein